MRGLRDKVAIVTGGGGAIGRAIACRLAEEGAVVGVLDRDADSGEQTSRWLRGAGMRAAAQAADIADYAAVAQAVAALEAHNGPTDILVNNAGWDRAGNFLDSSPAVWDALIAVNLVGPLNLHHVVLKGMVERRRGRVVNISSDAARRGIVGRGRLCCGQGGGDRLHEDRRSRTGELAHYAQRRLPRPDGYAVVFRLCRRGGSRPEARAALERAIPFKRLGQPKDIAPIVAFLASDEAGYITGQVISVSGGLTMHG